MSTQLPAPIANDTAYLRGLPQLSEAFYAAFQSVFLTANALRLHAVIGGTGPPLLLLAGWPQTWYAWRLVMPALAERYTVVALDPRGAGLSDKPATGYDTGTMAADAAQAMAALGYPQFAMVGLDVGMWTAYALAADYPAKVVRLAVGEAIIPGILPSAFLFASSAVIQRLWHFAFNRLDSVNEQLVAGREEIFFGHQFALKAARPDALPPEVVAVYIESLRASPAALTASFNYYRALDTTIAQNEERKKQPLAMPVLAIGGAQGVGQTAELTMRAVATHVRGLIIPDCGHFVPEEAPGPLTTALTAFFEPYRQQYAGLVPA